MRVMAKIAGMLRSIADRMDRPEDEPERGDLKRMLTTVVAPEMPAAVLMSIGDPQAVCASGFYLRGIDQPDFTGAATTAVSHGVYL